MSCNPKVTIDEKTISDASDITLFDLKGGKTTFGELLEGPQAKTVVILVRHFFCGRCQDYVRQLSGVKSDALKESNVRLVIIGCGDWNPIQFYSETTGFPADRIYANPDRDLFKAFNTKVNLAAAPAGQKPKSYVKDGLLSVTIRSIWKAMMNPSLVGKQGPPAQNGGEFIFTHDKKCVFAARMENSEDHVEVEDLMKEAGVPYP